MSSVNKVILLGNLGKDPEVRYTPDGTPVASFSLATSEKWTDKSGQTQENTEWHSIIAWNKLADICKRFLTKGSKAYIEGKIKTRSWTDRDGNQRKTTEIIASSIVLLGGKQGERSEPQPMASNDSFGDAGITDNDIPF